MEDLPGWGHKQAATDQHTPSKMSTSALGQNNKNKIDFLEQELQRGEGMSGQQQKVSRKKWLEQEYLEAIQLRHVDVRVL